MSTSRSFLFVNPSIEQFNAQTGGAISTVVHNVTRRLLELGHDVQVLAPADGHPMYADVPAAEIPFPEEGMRLPLRKAYGAHRRVQRFDFHLYGLYLRGLKRAIHRLDVDPDHVIVHNDLYAGRYLQRWLPRARRTLWVHNDLYTNARHPSRRLADSHHVIAVSQYVRRYLVRHLGARPSAVDVAYNGVDLETFKPSGTARPEGPLRVLFLGRLIPDKGADTLLRAVARLQQRGLAVHVTVMGSPTWSGRTDRDDPYLRDVIHPLLRKVNGTWLPQQSRDRVAAVLRQSHVVGVLTRTPDAFPLAALEALASGCAVIASRTGGIPEMAGACLRLCTPGSVEDVATHLMALAEDRRALDHLSVAGREWVRQFSWNATVDSFLDAVDLRAGPFVIDQAQGTRGRDTVPAGVDGLPEQNA